ncbi:hypothetical protein NLJ89_g5252 [Agrocybe chaxingu]|uniref:DUF6534 domain-containing protein n=1 Tax=Agrocybe chaxingu TaxID=84603 RepID=A0A9W8K158_9AGAR|nr:hypothetical protein NLJ89_g5252 [Agrocybe chaxingu]
MVSLTIANTFGAIEIGSFGAAFLFGVVTLQCYFYYSQNPEDSRQLKILVAVVWLLECAHTGLMIWEVYRLTIVMYGRAKDVHTYPGFSLVLTLGGFITTIVQCFFAYRVWKFLPKPYSYIGLASGLTACSRGIMSTYGAAEAVMMSSYAEFLVKYQNYLSIVLALGVAIDIVNAASMSYFLIIQREKGFSKTTNLIDRLVAYTIRTGVITCVSAITVLVLFQSLSPTLISFGFYVGLAKLYTNSLLSALNARRSLKENYSMSISVSHPRLAGTETSTSRIGPEYTQSNQAISIEMKTTKLISEDPAEEKAYDLESKRQPHCDQLV